MKTYLDNLFVAVVSFGVAVTFVGAVASDLDAPKGAPAADIVACYQLPHSVEV
ncbi:MAG: hypothetical protein JO218_01490 [Burkholderiales bacterium]|nr:hypothetical protein [Burkholderiales bacterium]